MKARTVLAVFLAVIMLSQAFISPLPLAEAQQEDPIGYCIDGDVVEIWNPDTSYFFNKTSGIQWVENPDVYWSRNVFGIGWFNSTGDYNEIYSADELGSFNRDIESDYSTYVTATLWRDFNYNGYDLRLGIQYHLGVEDTDLSVTLYAKNLDTEVYPVPLGLAWTVTDIDIPNPLGEDRVYLNETYYRLDEVHDVTFTDIKKEKFNNTDPLNPETGYWFTEYQPNYRISDYTEFITLEWDENIPYSVHLDFNGVQEDARITWMVNAGIFQSGQEKSTTLYWADAEGDYVGVWSLTGANGDPFSITTDGTNIWVTDTTDAAIYKYDMDGAYIGTWNLAAANAWPYGIDTDGTNIWVADYDDNVAYKYNMAGGAVGSFALTANNDHPRGITSDGTSHWSVGYDNKGVYKYNLAGTYQSTWAIPVANGSPGGITTNGTNIWITDSTDTRAYKYDLVGNAVSSWDLKNPENGNPRGITTDGDHFWVVDITDNDIYEYVLTDQTPTITSAAISDMDDGDNVYDMESYYSFVAVVNDADGATDIDKVYLQGKNGAAVLWEVRATDLTGAGSWAIQSGATIIDLDTGSCTWGEAGNVGTATFKVRLEWDHPDLANLEIAVYVEDGDGLSAGFTDMQTDYWDAIGRLVTSGFTTTASVAEGGAITSSGNVHYATTIGGDVASAKYPPDAQFTSVQTRETNNTVVGTDNAIINGAFSMGFNARSGLANLGNNNYKIYLNLVPDYVDGDAPDGDISTTAVYAATTETYELGAGVSLVSEAYNAGTQKYTALYSAAAGDRTVSIGSPNGANNAVWVNNTVPVNTYNATIRMLTVTIPFSSIMEVEVFWANVPPQNLDIVADSFDLNVPGWVNVTVSDINGVADLNTVDIQVNTTGDAENFTLRWTQASGLFSEESDPSNIITLNASVRVNITATADKIAFNFIFTGGSTGLCNVRVTTTDDSAVTAIDFYPDLFRFDFFVWTPVGDFINSAGDFWGISDIMGDLSTLITGLASDFSVGITNFLGMIRQQLRLVYQIIGWFITHFTGMVDTVLNVWGYMAQFLDGTGIVVTGVGNWWTFIALDTWIEGLYLGILILWIDSIAKRGRTQGEITVFLADVNQMINISSFFVSISLTVFELVFNKILTLFDAVMSVIPI